jgi:hypothetical protein
MTKTSPAQHGYYFQIMLTGGMVGLIVGYATQRYGRGPKLQQNIGAAVEGRPAGGHNMRFFRFVIRKESSSLAGGKT